jgi:NAD(P)H dehydrogenase (quinone)
LVPGVLVTPPIPLKQILSCSARAKHFRHLPKGFVDFHIPINAFDFPALGHPATIRPSMFLESFFPLAGLTVRDRGRIELPFGRGKTSPVAAADVARVVAAVLADPGPHLGRIYELTGPRSQDMHGVAQEFSDALNREVTYSDIPPEDWERELKRVGLPEHLTRHLVTMGELHRAGRYDRLADGVERVTGCRR